MVVCHPLPAYWGAGPPRRGRDCGIPQRGSAPPDTDDADVGNLLVDEVGHADPLWEAILIQLHASDDLASRLGRTVRDPGEELVDERSAIGRRQHVEVRLGGVGKEDAPGHA
jgi:hypothetical protein